MPGNASVSDCGVWQKIRQIVYRNPVECMAKLQVRILRCGKCFAFDVSLVFGQFLGLRRLGNRN